MPRLNHTAGALLACLVLAACGQHDGVHIGFQPGPNAGAGSGAGPGAVAPDVAPSTPEVPAGFAVDGAGDVSGDGVGDGVPGARDGAAGAPTGSGGGGGGTAASGSAPQAGGQTGGVQSQGTSQPAGQATPGGQPPGGQTTQDPTAPPASGGAAGDSTGITDAVIKVGGHAPLTGAAPIPQQSFITGKDLYWNHHGGPYDRSVETIIRDDQYNPSRATSVCNELIQREQVFLLLGAGGADQIAACARTAAQQGVPYLSAGVDEGVLRGLRNYFAFSMSYVQQADLLVDYIDAHARPSNNRIAIVRDRTPSFNNALTRFQQLAESRGYEILVRQTQNGPSDGQWLLQNQIETAFPLMAPSQWIQIVNAPGGAIDNWVGVGITMGLNSVATAGCPAIDGAMFFSPYPGINQADRIDPDFRVAGGVDDIQFALWGISKVIDVVFERMEGNLTRQAFVRALETNVIESGIYPTLRNTPENHFGADSVHMLVANCAQRRYETPDGGLFRTSFG
jgi:branched-chain amino acid transport system substrate-binding protein